MKTILILILLCGCRKEPNELEAAAQQREVSAHNARVEVEQAIKAGNKSSVILDSDWYQYAIVKYTLEGHEYYGADGTKANPTHLTHSEACPCRKAPPITTYIIENKASYPITFDASIVNGHESITLGSGESTNITVRAQ